MGRTTPSRIVFSILLLLDSDLEEVLLLLLILLGAEKRPRAEIVAMAIHCASVCRDIHCRCVERCPTRDGAIIEARPAVSDRKLVRNTIPSPSLRLHLLPDGGAEKPPHAGVAAMAIHAEIDRRYVDHCTCDGAFSSCNMALQGLHWQVVCGRGKDAVLAAPVIFMLTVLISVEKLPRERRMQRCTTAAHRTSTPTPVHHP
jgi:hypothetical protein